jgi:hypothetical protein
MVRLTFSYQLVAAFFLAVCLTVPWTARADDNIKTYTVPKERPAPVQPVTAPAAADGAMPASDIPVSAAPVHWTTPAGWQELAPTSIRLGNFAISGKGQGKAEVGIFSFPGSVGTELDNVNRWRRELQLPPVEAEQIAAEPVTIDSLNGRLYDILGASSSTVVASLPRQGATWFFKMRGDKETVANAKPAFLEFLKSIHFNAGGNEVPAASMSEGAIPSPHGSLAPAARPEPESSGGEPKWTVPENWTEKKAGAMVFKTYAAANGNGKTASVNISFFPGDVGGAFANVNRWRAQLGLPPVAHDKLESVTQALDTEGGKATLVDFTGTDSRTGQPARLVAVMVPHGDNTWFYKLSGEGAVVGDQKESFVKFVQTVHYP